MNTIRNRWIVLRSFYRWAAYEGEVEVNPLARVIDRPDVPAPQVLTPDELRALLNACRGHHVRRSPGPFPHRANGRHGPPSFGGRRRRRRGGPLGTIRPRPQPQPPRR